MKREKLNYRLNKNKLFKRIFSSILAIFVAFLLITCVIASIELYDSHIAALQKTWLSSLSSIRAQIEQQISETDIIFANLIGNTTIYRALSYGEEVEPAHELDFWSIEKALVKASSPYKDLKDIGLYFSESKNIVTRSGKYRFDLYSGKFQDMLFADKTIVSSLNNYYSRQLLTSDLNEDTGFTYVVSMPFGANMPYSTLFITFGAKSMRETLNSLKADNPECRLIVCFDGSSENTGTSSANYLQTLLKEQFLLQNEDSVTIEYDGNKYLAFCSASTSGFSVYSMLPYETVNAPIYHWIARIIIIGLLMAGVLIVFSYGITRIVYRPVLSLMDDLSKAVGLKAEGIYQDEVLFINQIVDLAYQKNERLYHLADSFKYNLVYHVLQDILNGESILDLDIALDFPHNRFVVLVIYIEDAPNNIGIDYMLRERINSKTDDSAVYVMPPNNHRISLVLNISEQHETENCVYNLAEHILGWIQDSHGEECAIGIGATYSHLQDIRRSFIEAMIALDSARINGTSICHINEQPNAAHIMFEYSMEKENRLLNSILKGNKDEVAIMLDELLPADSLNDDIAGSEKAELMRNALSVTLIRSKYIKSEEADVDSWILDHCSKTSASKSSLKPFVNEIKNEIMKETERNSMQSQTKSLDIYKAIIKYIEEHYGEELSLGQIADKLNYSPAYLSHLFKQESGQNFVDYLNSYRIEKAKHLLSETEMQISEIAARTGFITRNTFNRVFKKYVGVTPSEYKNL